VDDLNKLVAWKHSTSASEEGVHAAREKKLRTSRTSGKRTRSAVKYFMVEWNEKKENVIKAYRARCGKGIHTNNALEGYHAAIKRRFLDCKSTRGARLDWLLHVLLDVVMPQYQKMQALEDLGIKINKHLEEQTLKAYTIVNAIGEDGVKVIRKSRSTRSCGRFTIKSNPSNAGEKIEWQRRGLGPRRRDHHSYGYRR
jgi:hypothetical protein